MTDRAREIVRMQRQIRWLVFWAGVRIAIERIAAWIKDLPNRHSENRSPY